MTQDEIRKLLGGYATNALSADERRTLFEAALEDQELFNALQNEDALRELLADPVLRDQVRSALATPTRTTPREGFSWRRWSLGVAITAAAAVIVIAVMNRAKAPEPSTQPVQMARAEPKQVEPAPEAAAPPVAEKRSTPAGAARQRAIPAPTLAAPTRAPSASNEVASKSEPEPPPALKKQSIRASRPQAAALQLESAQRDAAPAATSFGAASVAPVIPEAVRQQFAAGFAANAPLYQGPLVRFSVARGGQDGDAVRVDVSTAIAGYLALYHVDAAGNSKRVYPANGVATQVLPNIAMQIPINPVKVDAGEKLRLVLVPAVAAGVVGALGGAVNNAVQPEIRKPLPSSTPLVVEIPLGPN
jgi:cytoskeletal protein RodZ